MQPLSYRRRSVYVLLLGLVFAAIVPGVLLYANGYRWKSGEGLVRTGGLFVTVPYSDATVYVNGKPVGAAGFLRHTFYIDNLVPDAYTIQVERTGYHTWTRIMVVEQQLVTDAQALLVSDTISKQQLLVGTTTATVSTTTQTITAAERAAILKVFAAPTPTTTTGALAEVHGQGLFVEGGDTIVRWIDPSAYAPSVYCGRPLFCGTEIAIERGPLQSTYAAFFDGGVVYTTKEHGVAFAEADVRPTQVRLPIYDVRGADFRIIDGRLIVKDGTKLYEITSL